MKLDPRDIAVQAFVQYAQKQLDPLRLALERPGATHDETQFLRGQIKALRKIIALPEEVNNGRISLDTD